MENIIENKNRIFGLGEEVTNDSRESGLNNNDMIIGSSGSGKTGSYVIGNINQHYGSMIVTDTKGAISKMMTPSLRAAGYRVEVLDFVNPANSTVSYNPLDYIRYNVKGEVIEQDVLRVAHSIVSNTVDNRDPFWENSARTLLTCLIGYVMEDLVEEDRNMYSVLELSKLLVENINGGVKFLDEWELLHPDSFASRRYRLFKSSHRAEKMWMSIVQIMFEAINIFDYKQYSNIFAGQSRFRIEDISDRNTVLFLNVSDMDRSFDRVVNTFYTQALHCLCQKADNSSEARLKIPVRLIIDDFASSVQINDFDKIISVIRSRELSVSLVLQSLSQLNAMYGEANAKTIINNCDHILYLGGSDLDTAQFIGTHANRTPNNVLALENDKAYLIVRGRGASLIDKIKPYSIDLGEYEYFEDYYFDDDEMPFDC